MAHGSCRTLVRRDEGWWPGPSCPVGRWAGGPRDMGGCGGGRGAAPVGEEGMMTSVVVSGEGAERDTVPAARCCGWRGEETGAGGRRGRSWAGGGGQWPQGPAGAGFALWGGMGGSGRQCPGPERGSHGGTWRQPERQLSSRARLRSASRPSNKPSWCALVPTSPLLRPQRHPTAGQHWGGRVAWLRDPCRGRHRSESGGGSSLGAPGFGVGMEPGGGRSALRPAPRPSHGGSVPAGEGGRRPGGLRRGGAGPSRARRSRHVVSHPLDLLPKKHFLLLRSGVKACVGRAGAHLPRVTLCRWRQRRQRRRQWGAGAPCLHAELP